HGGVVEHFRPRWNGDSVAYPPRRSRHRRRCLPWHSNGLAAGWKLRYLAIRSSSWENRMRLLFLGAAVLGTLALQPAMAQRQCTSPTDQSAFEVQALRSELMVLATGCREGDRYNAFMRRY